MYVYNSTPQLDNTRYPTYYPTTLDTRDLLERQSDTFVPSLKITTIIKILTNHRQLSIIIDVPPHADISAAEETLADSET